MKMRRSPKSRSRSRRRLGGQKAALAEGSMEEKECEDENDEDCLEIRILDPQTIEMAEVSFGGAVRMGEVG